MAKSVKLELSAADHIAQCLTQEHVCVCGSTTSCKDDDFWDEWSRIIGQLILGERVWLDIKQVWCSPDCLIRWIGLNYYSDGVGATWVRAEREGLLDYEGDEAEE